MCKFFLWTFNLLLPVFLDLWLLNGFQIKVEAGVCWLKRLERGDDEARCRDLYSSNVTREECCVVRRGMGFTENDLSDVEYFFAMAIGEGATCSSCLDTCDKANCGKEKRCVLRDGKPKCICAPVCKKVVLKKPQRNLRPKHVILVDSFNSRRDVNQWHHANASKSVISFQNGHEEAELFAPFDHNQRSRRKRPARIDTNQIKHQTVKPVCGTDGRTYKTECQLKKRACRRNLSQLQVAYRGHCQSSCKFVTCPDGKYCLEDQDFTPHCVHCLRKCPPAGNPSKIVCGADGFTYASLCALQQASCMLGKSIPFAYKGQCKMNASCESIKCKNRQSCVKDYVTRMPRCLTCRFKCTRRRHLKNRSEGNRICATNNRTYTSWCNMMRDSCSSGMYFDAKHTGECNY